METVKEYKAEMIRFRATKKEKAKLKELAKRSNMTVSEYILYNTLYIYDPTRREAQ